MPLKVSAVLNRQSGVYLAGETLQCKITLQCNDADEICRFVVVQVYGQEIISHHYQQQKIAAVDDGNKNRQQLRQTEIAGGSTSFVVDSGEHGRTIFSSETEILCCDLNFKAGECKDYSFSYNLPRRKNLPPSFKGSAVKYVYKMSVGVQAGRRAVKLLKIPFRFLSSTDYTEENSAVLRKTQIFRVADEQRGEICSIKVERKIHKLGDDVSAILEFENSNFRCFEFSAFLQTVEEVNDQKKKNEITYCEKTEFCAFYKSCQLDLQIPTRAPPSFFTDFINLKWRLHFEFSVAESAINDKIWLFDPRMMDKEKVKRLVWDLPLKVFPCNPIHVDTEKAKDFVLCLQ